MRENAVRAMRIEQELQAAIEHGDLRLYFQPGVRLGTGQVVGAEALVRWEHPERGLIMPDRFLGVAEETGLIVPLGAWVVEEACRQLAEWQSRAETAHMHVSLNLSARELTHPDVVSTVLTCVRESGVDPRGLTIEVTESTAMADGDTGFRALRDLSGEGIRVAIDDFGTGYSSLEQLRRMPVDVVKVDRSFVRGMAADSIGPRAGGGGGRHGPGAEADRGRRGDRDTRAGRGAARARLRHRPGLPVREAAARSRS